jgi:TPP-dependent pyruvate/acetoin dehydrogenase alpha subunit
MAMQHAREGHGPVLLVMYVTRSVPDEYSSLDDRVGWQDPLLRCQRFLQELGSWDPAWAAQLYARFSAEVERAMRGAL